MIIFIAQKKSIKTEDNFQTRKASTKPKPLKQRQSIKDDHNNQQSQSHLEQNSDQTSNCNFKGLNPS
jgi:hypothetical protein